MADWWRTYFDDVFYDLHEALFPEQNSRREVAATLQLLGLPAGSRVLDVPCGWGRHTRLLPEAGLAAYGADISEPLLRRGAAAMRAAGLPLRLAAADLRRLPFRSGTFDAVLNLFTSLGLFLDDREDVAALCETARVLAPGGRLVLESMHRDDVVAAFAERDRWTLPDGTEVRVRRRFDPVTGISRERWRWRRGGLSGDKRHVLRLRTATEIDGLLAAAGFPERTYFGDWDCRPLRHDSPRLIVLARTAAHPAA
jgi:ubiquinone/menaquinone biosynthesis C-methylase UbiE